MNRETTEGKFDQMKGKVKESVGEAVGNQKLANSGAADQVKGAAKEAWGNTKDAARSVANDAHARAEAHNHDVRSKITSTAQNAKNSINDKVQAIKEDHKRSA
jgi:uncharacterized protein YjbJ (UPF0337 family)